MLSVQPCFCMAVCSLTKCNLDFIEVWLRRKEIEYPADSKHIMYFESDVPPGEFLSNIPFNKP